VFDLTWFTSFGCLQGHTGPVLTLQVIPADAVNSTTLLVSSSLDTDFRVWDLERMCCIAVITGNVGAVFALAFEEPRLFCSCQDTTIKSFDLRATLAHVALPAEGASGAEHLAGSSSPRRDASGPPSTSASLPTSPAQVNFADVNSFLVGRSHHGYVNNLVLARGRLFSASGDSTIKVDTSVE
jgi:WD40 repeat protein